jgi:hypothetical protein
MLNSDTFPNLLPSAGVGLDKCSPKVHMLKAWSGEQHYQETFKGPLVFGDIPLEGIVRPSPLPFPSFCFRLLKFIVFPCYVFPAIAMGPLDHGLEPPKL